MRSIHFCCAPSLVTLAIVLCGAVTSVTASVFDQIDLFVAGEDGYHTYRIPSMAVMTDGTILAFAEGRKSSASDSGDIDIVMRSSSDNGQTWSDMQLVYEEGGSAAITIGNPTPVVDDVTGDLFLFFSRNNEDLFVMSSSDSGHTFTSPIEISSVAENFDYDWSRLGPGPTAGIQISNGRLSIPIWLNQTIGDPDEYRVGTLYSDDHGTTWQASTVTPINSSVRGVNESAIIELTDGTIYMTQRTNAGVPARGKSFSSDGGETWTETVVESGINPSMSAVKTSIMRYSTIEDSGQNLLLYTAPAASDRNNMTVWLSDDEAKTWSTSRGIYNGPSGYSELAIAADQTILTLYESGTSVYYEKITLARYDLDWLTSPDSAISLENGDFENTTNWGNAGTTEPPIGWTISGARKNAAVQQSGVNAIGGSGTSAYLPAYPTSDGSLQREIRQGISSGSTSDSWLATFDIASEDPGNGDQRSLSMGLTHSGGQLTLRIVDSDNNGIGDLQHYSGGWQTISSLMGSITFDSDVQTLPQANQVSIYGHYDLESPCYDIIVTNANGETFTAIGLAGWLNAAPLSGDLLSNITFNTFLSDGDCLIDNVSLISLIPGDANGDGRVDGSDVTIVANNWQTASDATWNNGDFNSDGKVDGSDVTILANNWQYNATASAASVPEPHFCFLFIGSLMSAAWFFLKKTSKKDYWLYQNQSYFFYFKTE